MLTNTFLYRDQAAYIGFVAYINVDSPGVCGRVSQEQAGDVSLDIRIFIIAELFTVQFNQT